MSDNAKCRWFLLAPLLLAILFAFGCVYASSTIGYLTAKEISYTPDQSIEPWFRETGPKIFIHEFDNKGGSSWFNLVPKHVIGIPLDMAFPNRRAHHVEYCGPLYVYVNCPQLFKMYSPKSSKL